ncbi:MAG: aminotransferase class V-fold PLP-dependent enzyme [Dongiaceae bacterium]
MTIDISRARRDTLTAAHLLHFNNAGAALPPVCVLDAVTAHLTLEAANGRNEAAATAHDRHQQIYRSNARLIGCQPDEIALVENATVAWNLAFHSIRLTAGDRILTARAEYASNFIGFLQVARRTGARIEVVPSEASGELDIAALEEMIDERVKLIAITHVPTNGGLVNPAAAVGKIARRHGIIFLLDACQSIGQMPVLVDAIGCDLLSATGRKYLRGPRGTGFLYVRRSLLDRLEPPFLDLHAATWVTPDRYELLPDARRFENWDSNIAAQLGLGAAVDYALGCGLSAIAERVTALAQLLRHQLALLPGVIVRDIGRQRCGIVSFTVADRSATELVAKLRSRRINCSVSTPNSTLLDANARSLPDLLRASVHYYNSEEEVARFASAIADLTR